MAAIWVRASDTRGTIQIADDIVILTSLPRRAVALRFVIVRLLAHTLCCRPHRIRRVSGPPIGPWSKRRAPSTAGLDQGPLGGTATRLYRGARLGRTALAFREARPLAPKGVDASCPTSCRRERSAPRHRPAHV